MADSHARQLVLQLLKITGAAQRYRNAANAYASREYPSQRMHDEIVISASNLDDAIKESLSILGTVPGDME